MQNNYPLPWSREHSEPGPDLKLFRARFDHMRNPRNGAVERMIVLEAADSVTVAARTPRDELLLVRQYRFGTECYTLELPGGIVDAGEDPATAARRELGEETGYTADRWTSLGRIANNPVYMDNYVHFYYAENVIATRAQQLDAGEAIEVVKLPLSEVRRRLEAGEFEHPHTVIALFRFFRIEGDE